MSSQWKISVCMTCGFHIWCNKAWNQFKSRVSPCLHHIVQLMMAVQYSTLAYLVEQLAAVWEIAAHLQNTVTINITQVQPKEMRNALLILQKPTWQIPSIPSPPSKPPHTQVGAQCETETQLLHLYQVRKKSSLSHHWVETDPTTMHESERIFNAQLWSGFKKVKKKKKKNVSLEKSHGLHGMQNDGDQDPLSPQGQVHPSAFKLGLYISVAP